MPCSVCGGQDHLLHNCNYCGEVVCDKHRIPEKHDCNILGKWFDGDYWFDSNLNQHHHRGTSPGKGAREGDKKQGEKNRKSWREKKTSKNKTQHRGAIPSDAPDVVWKCTQCEIVFDSNPPECPRCSEPDFYRKPIEGLEDPSSYRSYKKFIGAEGKAGGRLLAGFTKVDIIVLVFLLSLAAFLGLMIYRNFDVLITLWA